MNRTRKLEKLMTGTLLFLILSFPANTLFSQIWLNGYTETGTNNVSEGFYEGVSGQVSAKFHNFKVQTGGLFYFSNANNPVFSAYKLQLENIFSAFKIPLTITAFYLWKPFSDDLNETNVGALLSYESKHFGCELGLNTRFYYFNQQAILKYGFTSSTSTSIWEPVNAMYRVSYYLPVSPKTEFEASITNFDFFQIEQETNPQIRLGCNYKLNEKMLLYGNLGYLEAGLLNMRVNTFGVFLRAGVVWQIN